MPKRTDIEGPWNRPLNENQLPKLSVVLTREDGHSMVISCWPTDAELRFLTTNDLIDRYFKPIAAKLQQQYPSLR